MSIFASAKDRVLEQAAISYLNNQILSPFGRATGLRINSAAKTLAIELELNGEASPLSLEIRDYEFSQSNGRYFLLVRSVQTSREWLTALANKQFCGQRIEIPEQAGRWLAQML